MAGPAVLKIDIVTDARGAAGGIAQTEGKLSSLGSTASKAGLAVKAGLAGAGIAVVALGKQAYDAASNVQQAFGAVETVYGKHAGLIKDLANTAADSVGLAKSQYADLAALLGSQLTNMGRSQQAAANETENLIQLGADLAATYGGTAAEAVEALSSVLKGETDPIERYGISIKQSDINARLAAKGQDELKGTALKSATATAALGLVFDQSSKAQGAFARESDTAAGQQQRLSANVENLKARLGAGLLPIMTNVFEFINTRAIPYGTQLASTLSERLGPTVSRVGAFIREDLIPAARQFYTWFAERIAPNIRDAMIPIVNGLRSAFEKIQTKIEANRGSLEKLGRFLKSVAEFASDLEPIIGTVLGTAFDVLGTAIGLVIDAISTLIDLIDAAVDGAKKLADAISSIPGAGLVGKGIGAIGGLFGSAPLVGQVGRLVGRSAPVSTDGLGTLTTAAAGGFYLGGGSSSASALLAPAVVDARRFYSIDASGSIDPLATADRLADVLRRDDVRKGRVPSFAPATGWSG